MVRVIYIYIYIYNSFLAGNFFDITKTKGKDIAKDIDIFTYSFPCQDLSVQGKQMGMKAKSNTKSSLIWQVGRILRELKKENNLPKYLLMENVCQVANNKNIASFRSWIGQLTRLGYESKYYFLNAADFGSCQNRKRCFMISVLKDHKKSSGFEFPNFDDLKVNSNATISSILDRDFANRTPLEKLHQYNRTDFNETKQGLKKCSLLEYTTFNTENYVYHIDHKGPTLTASGANSRIKFIKDNKIYYLNGREALRYMGFTDEDYNKLTSIKFFSEQDIIFLAGNSIAVQVLEVIFRSFKF